MIRLQLCHVDGSIDYDFMRLCHRIAHAERRRKSIAPEYRDEPTGKHSALQAAN